MAKLNLTEAERERRRQQMTGINAKKKPTAAAGGDAAVGKLPEPAGPIPVGVTTESPPDVWELPDLPELDDDD